MNDDAEIQDLIENFQLATDYRLCPVCGLDYDANPAVFAFVRLADGSHAATWGGSLTHYRCDKCNVTMIA